MGWVHGAYSCRNDAWEEAAERALQHYRQSGWPATRCVGELASALFYGPRPVEEALPRVASLLDESIGRGGEANLLSIMAILDAFRGRFVEARELIGRAQQTFEELGSTLASLAATAREGMIELLAGETDAAVRLYVDSCTALERRGFRAHLSTQAAELSCALYEHEAYDEAEQWAEVARANTGDGDISAEFSWRSALGMVRARQGALEEAEALVREAVTLVEATDALNQRGNVLVCLGEVLRIAGRPAEAARAVDEAVNAYGRKGNTVSAERARAMRAELVSV